MTWVSRLRREPYWCTCCDTGFTLKHAILATLLPVELVSEPDKLEASAGRPGNKFVAAIVEAASQSVISSTSTTQLTLTIYNLGVVQLKGFSAFACLRRPDLARRPDSGLLLRGGVAATPPLSTLSARGGLVVRWCTPPAPSGGGFSLPGPKLDHPNVKLLYRHATGFDCC